jgi:hypothetical protein
MQKYANDPNLEDKEKQEDDNKRATKEQQLETFYSGALQYLGLGGTVSELSAALTTIALNIGKYLPLDLKQLYALSKNIYLTGKNLYSRLKNDGVSLTAFQESAQELIDLEIDKNRTFMNLNDSIRQRINFMSKFSISWKNLQNISGLVNSALEALYNKIGELKEDVGLYVGSSPERSINSNAVLSAKMSI